MAQQTMISTDSQSEDNALISDYEVKPLGSSKRALLAGGAAGTLLLCGAAVAYSGTGLRGPSVAVEGPLEILGLIEEYYRGEVDGSCPGGARVSEGECHDLGGAVFCQNARGAAGSFGVCKRDPPTPAQTPQPKLAPGTSGEAVPTENVEYYTGEVDGSCPGGARVSEGECHDLGGAVFDGKAAGAWKWAHCLHRSVRGSGCYHHGADVFATPPHCQNARGEAGSFAVCKREVPTPALAPTDVLPPAAETGCDAGGKVRLSSHLPPYVLHNEGDSLRMEKAQNALSEWHMEAASDGFFYFKSNQGKYICVDDSGKNVNVQFKGDACKWDLMDAGAGQSFIRSVTTSLFLQDAADKEVRGVNLVDRPDGLEKWYIHNLEGKKPCEMDHLIGH